MDSLRESQSLHSMLLTADLPSPSAEERLEGNRVVMVLVMPVGIRVCMVTDPCGDFDVLL